MDPKSAKQPEKKPALKDLQTFENSKHFTRVMGDALAALSVRLEHNDPGFGASPDLIKIDARSGEGLLMDYEVSLNMKAELMMLQPYCGRPAEEVAYYMSLEQSPMGGLGLSHKQWIDLMQGKEIENLERIPAPQEVQDRAISWLRGLNAAFTSRDDTKTLIQDVIDARFGRREEGISKEEGETNGGSRWEVWSLDSVDVAE